MPLDDEFLFCTVILENFKEVATSITSNFNKDELETRITATKRVFLIDPQRVDRET